MTTLLIDAQPHSTSMPSFYGLEKPVELGARVWRQRRPAGQLVAFATGIDVNTTENCTRASEVEHRHT